MAVFCQPGFEINENTMQYSTICTLSSLKCYGIIWMSKFACKWANVTAILQQDHSYINMNSTCRSVFLKRRHRFTSLLCRSYRGNNFQTCKYIDSTLDYLHRHLKLRTGDSHAQVYDEIGYITCFNVIFTNEVHFLKTFVHMLIHVHTKGTTGNNMIYIYDFTKYVMLCPVIYTY